MPANERWALARRVRDQVEHRLGARPEVRMIDLGAAKDGSPIVQVHVERALTLADLAIEAQIEGIPIEVRRAANFRLE